MCVRHSYSEAHAFAHDFASVHTRVRASARARTRAGAHEEGGALGDGVIYDDDDDGAAHARACACTRVRIRAHVAGVGDDEMREAVAQLTAMGFGEELSREVGDAARSSAAVGRVRPRAGGWERGIGSVYSPCVWSALVWLLFYLFARFVTYSFVRFARGLMQRYN